MKFANRKFSKLPDNVLVPSSFLHDCMPTQPTGFTKSGGFSYAKPTKPHTAKNVSKLEKYVTPIHLHGY